MAKKKLASAKRHDEKSDNKLNTADIVREMKKDEHVAFEKVPREFAATMRKIKIINRHKTATVV